MGMFILIMGIVLEVLSKILEITDQYKLLLRRDLVPILRDQLSFRVECIKSSIF